ncbi:MAG: hypothetical protein HY652_05590 [Acidobacteria bacterium]|nr:hypothetical protein [Acidobacteriota bacterium]
MEARGRSAVLLYGGLAALLVVGFLALSRLQQGIDLARGQYHSTEEVLYLASGKVIERMTLGYRALAADLYWLRTIQYYGGKKKDSAQVRYDLLEPLLEITTHLDPRMIPAYQFGATFLSTAQPMGLGRPDKGIRLLRKGIAANAGSWRLYFDLGFLYYWELHDFQKAGEVFVEGARVPEAPPWMEAVAATLFAKGGAIETAKYLWQKQHEEARNEQLKQNAYNHLLSIRVDEDIWTLEFLVERFQQRFTRKPESLQEMIGAGLLRGLPQDPGGFPYRYDAATGQISQAPDSTMRHFKTFKEYRDTYLTVLREKYAADAGDR